MRAGWVRKRLDEIGVAQTGSTPSTSDRSHYGDFIPFIKPADFRTDGSLDYGNDGLTEKGLSQARRVAAGSVLMVCIGATIGKCGYCDREITTNQQINSLTPFSGVCHKFIYYQMLTQGFQQNVLLRSGQATLPIISKSKWSALTVAVPPELHEQQRIVGILDEAFEGIATAKANAEKNLQNARALFESHLESVFSKRGEEWDKVTLETLLARGWIESHLDGNHGSDYPRKNEFIDAGVPYISANCINDERVDMSRAKYLSPSRASLLRKGIAKPNDVLFAHNATVGPVAILHTEEEKVVLGTSLTYYRCNLKHILPEYLAHYMRSFEFKTQYLQVMRQSTRNQVPITKQREFFHIIPPLDEQRRIIGTLDGLFDGGQRLESIYRQKLVALDALKESLLHQAFSGGL